MYIYIYISCVARVTNASPGALCMSHACATCAATVAYHTQVRPPCGTYVQHVCHIRLT